VVLVNDGWEDIEDLIREFSGQLKINYLKHPERRGRPAALNTGLKNSSGQYISFLDDDDAYYTRHLEVLVRHLVNSDYKIAYTSTISRIYKESEKNGELEFIKDGRHFDSDFDKKRILFENFIPIMSVMLERSVFETIGDFDEKMEIYEDWDCWIRASRLYDFLHIKETTAEYRCYDEKTMLPLHALKFDFEDWRKRLSEKHGKYISAISAEDKDSLIQSLEESIADMKMRIKSLERSVSEKDGAISALNDTINQKDIHLSRLEDRLEQKDAQLNHIYNSHGWKALEVYYRFRDKFLPEGTRRKTLAKSIFRFLFSINFENLEKFLRHIRAHGLINTLRNVPGKLREGDSARWFEIKPLAVPRIPPISFDQTLPTIDKKVSIIIPTRDAGRDFGHLLRKLKIQKGIRERETIIVDSGSTDGTLLIAREEGAKIVEIPSESFTHSFSRNKGAESATGDYLLFMVQDALPLTDTWLVEMVRVLEQGNVVAISCAEYPRSDVDLFYKMITWNHYRTLGLETDRVLNWDRNCSTYMGLRSNAQLSDITLLIKREVFDKYGFRARYAEDLELGARIIKDGLKLGFLYSTRVLHSHNRAPYYFIKRAYVDNKFLAEIFNNFGHPHVKNRERVLYEIVSLYYRLNYVANALEELKQPVSLKSLIEKTKGLLLNGDVDLMLSQNGSFGDKNFHGLIKSFMRGCEADSFKFLRNKNKLFGHFLYNFDILERYMSDIYETVDEGLIKDFISTLYKILALQSGCQLAYLYLTLSKKGKIDGDLEALDKSLIAGI
jgi:glycosyltransferase involved in cell wall biosynthesis